MGNIPDMKTSSGKLTVFQPYREQAHFFGLSGKDFQHEFIEPCPQGIIGIPGDISSNNLQCHLWGVQKIQHLGLKLLPSNHHLKPFVD